MGIQINTEPNTLVSSLYTKAKNYTSNLLNSDTKDFAQYLNENFDSIDENQNSSLSKDEITSAVRNTSRDAELQRIINNNNIEDLTSQIDKNQDGAISKIETNTTSNVPEILKSALRGIQNNESFGFAAQNLTQNLCKNFYANPQLTAMATSAVSYLL